MHQNKQHLFRERRLAFQNASPEVPVNPEKANILSGTHELLENLRSTVGEPIKVGAEMVKDAILPSKEVTKALSETVVKSGMAAFNVALFGSIFAAGFYMICMGKAPPQVERLLGKKPS